MRRASRAGFSLVELSVVVAVAGILVVALQQVYMQHRRFADWQQRLVGAHDSYRVTSALLAADLREAVPSLGDLTLVAADRISVRSPVGFGLVCAVQTANARIGINRLVGRMPQVTGDSILVYATTGWRVAAVVAIETPGTGSMSCGGRVPDAQFRVATGGAADVPVGGPIRAFRRHAYHLTTNGGQPWLARTDAAGTEPLVGPVAGGGLRFRLLDEDGAETANLSLVAGVEFRVILPSRVIPGAATVPADTALSVMQVRNR